LSTAVGDEGGFAPTLAGGTEDALIPLNYQWKCRIYFWWNYDRLRCAAAEFL
jgi:enolase